MKPYKALQMQRRDLGTQVDRDIDVYSSEEPEWERKLAPIGSTT